MFDIDKFTGYEKLMKNFRRNEVSILSYELDQDGNDFYGFEAEIFGILSNGLRFIWSHDKSGQAGIFEVRTKKGTLVQSSRFNLEDIACGFAEVLEGRLNVILSFDF